MSKGRLARWEWTAVTLLLLIAFGFSIVNFHSVPPGVIHDEVLNYLNAQLIQNGNLRALYPFGGGREALPLMLQAASFSLLGDNLLALRWPSLLLNLIAIAGTFALFRRWFGPAVALFTCFAMLSAFWWVLMVRVGTRETALAPLLVLTIYTYARGLDTNQWGWFSAGGVLLGLTLYTHPPGLVAPFLIGGWLLLKKRPTALASFVLTAIIAVPLLVAWAQPETTTRYDEIGAPLVALQQGDPRPILRNIPTTAGMLTIQGDRGSEFNNPHQPLIPTLPMAFLFYVGLMLVIYRVIKGQQPYALLLMWLVGLLIPTLLTERPVLNYRASGIPSVLYLFPALTLAGAAQLAERYYPRARSAVILVALLALGTHAVHTTHTYFMVWRTNPVVEFLYQSDYRALADDLDTSPPAAPPAVGGLTPRLMDPSTMRLLMADDTLAAELTFFDPQTALVLPPHNADIIIPAFVTMHPNLQPLIGSGTMREAYTIHTPPPTPVPTLNTTFAQAITLNHASLISGELAPGEGGTVITIWQPRAPLPADVRIFLHVIGPQGALLTQSDVLGLPAQNWREGQTLIQAHDLTLPTDAPPGPYHLRIGLYEVATGSRLQRPDGSDSITITIPPE
jgi:hypothetical protein